MVNNNYNDEPVIYCTRCLSLNIYPIDYPENKDYCRSCGSTNTAMASIEEWERKYEEFYKKPHITKSK